jgi:hypothetical protein
MICEPPEYRHVTEEVNGPRLICFTALLDNWQTQQLLHLLLFRTEITMFEIP